jgi:predicted DNA binding protein
VVLNYSAVSISVMRYVRLALDQPADSRHPMHQFVVDHDDYRLSRLLEFAPPVDGVHTLLFHVQGPRHPYESALAEEDRIREYDLSPCADDSFFVYVRERLSKRGESFVAALSRPGLIVVFPIEYRADGTVRLTAVGPAGKIQRAVEETPAEMAVDVLSIGEYDARRLDAGSDLTDRQFEAVVTAVDCGYYDTPREGTVSDVAAELDCAPGTAAELLRRAERTVMGHVVSVGNRGAAAPRS